MAEPRDDDATIRFEAQRAGLRQDLLPTWQDVRHRRAQLLGTMAFVLCGAAAALVLLSSPGAADAAVAQTHSRIAVLLLVVGFVAYAVEKELHLRRLSRLVKVERERNLILTRQLYDYASVLEAARALNSVLSLRDVVDQLLNGALLMVGGAGGAVHLLEDGDVLTLAHSMGAQADPQGSLRGAKGLAGRAAATRQAQLVQLLARDGVSPNGRAISAPLVDGDELVGVLTVVSGTEHDLGQRELNAVRLLAEQAAPGLRAARRYELQRRRVTQLFQLLEQAPERLPSGAHDLRTPLQSIISCSRMARDGRMPADERAELLTVMGNQSHRLSTMIEDLLGVDDRSGTRPVNMTAVVTEIAERQRLAGQPIQIHTAQACYAVADPNALARAIAHLVDNAYRYGRPPVQVGIRHHAESVLVSVWDHGTGIPVEDRELVFERGTRLDDEAPTLGLGLAIVRDLVEGCGGRVWADAAPDGGAAVHMSLPTAASEAAFVR